MAAGIVSWLNAPNCVPVPAYGNPYSGLYTGGPNVPSDGNISFFEHRGVTEWERATSSGDLRRLFERCGALASLLMRKAEAFANGSMEVLNATTGNYTRGKYKEWDRLFNQPNPIQSRRQFMKQIKLYSGLYGYCYALKLYPVGMEGTVPYQMWVLPPWLLKVKRPRRVPFYELTEANLLQGVAFDYAGVTTPIRPESLMLYTDNEANYDEDTWLPRSRCYSMRSPISILLSAEEAEATMIQRKGALGILTNRANDAIGHQAVNEEEKLTLQADYSRYGLTRDQWQLIITNANLEYQSMTFPTKDLLLQESYLKAVKDLYEGYGVPFPLSAHSDQATYNNVEGADRLLYQNTIWPEAKDFCEQLNRNLKAPDNNVLFNLDYSQVPALQESQKDSAEGRKATNDALLIEWEAGKITMNDWKIALGEDVIQAEPFTLYKYQWDKWMRDNGYTVSFQPGTGDSNNLNNLENGTAQQGTGA